MEAWRGHTRTPGAPPGPPASPPSACAPEERLRSAPSASLVGREQTNQSADRRELPPDAGSAPSPKIWAVLACSKVTASVLGK